jgi:MoaA/NifB/PqqE/SkfB family radical SAM enzyme
MGVRILILEGGEPLLWRDGRHTIADVIDAAHDRFASVCLTTNGTLSWDGLALDRVWVSLDGPERIHDSVRGYGVFKRAWQHVQKCRGRNLLVSTTIGTHNVDGAPELLELLAEESAGMTVQFYYPYGGLPDPLFLPLNQRRAALDELIRLKRKGLPVANSFAGLRQLKQPGWACEDNLLANAEPDGITFQGCYLKGRGDSQCTLCGFAAHNEMTLAFAGRLESIRNGIRIFL